MNRCWRILRLERNTTVVASPGLETTPRVAITFDFWRDLDEKALPKAYGESFFARRGIGQVHVFGHWNHWFQVEEMERMLDAIREATAAADTRISYGSSMGGFAALVFAERLDVDVAIALTPQYSIDPRKGWDEPRFRASARAIVQHHETFPDGLTDPFQYEILDQVRLPAQTYVIYDPGFGPDVAHVEAIRRYHEVIPVLCLNGGHWADVALRDAGLLSHVIEGVIEGTLESPAVYQLKDPLAAS